MVVILMYVWVDGNSVARNNKGGKDLKREKQRTKERAGDTRVREETEIRRTKVMKVSGRVISQGQCQCCWDKRV
jgi:hypothetical protein